MKDGTLSRSETFSTLGEIIDHVDLVWIMEEFRRITSFILGMKKQEKLLGPLIGNLEISVRRIVDFINQQ